MKTRFSRFLLPLGLVAIVIGFAACKGSTDATVRITVLQNAIDQINQNRSLRPLCDSIRTNA